MRGYIGRNCSLALAVQKAQNEPYCFFSFCKEICYLMAKYINTELRLIVGVCFIPPVEAVLLCIKYLRSH